MNKKELEKMFEDKITSMRIYDEYWVEITDIVQQFMYKTIIQEVLKSIIPKEREYDELNDDNYEVWFNVCIWKIKRKLKDNYNITL